MIPKGSKADATQVDKTEAGAPPLRILLLEDNDRDAVLLQAQLRRDGFAPCSARADNQEAFLAALEDRPDLILSDHQMPQFTAVDALALLQERKLDIPFIIVSGTISEELAVTALRKGAADYLNKDRLARLGAAISGALEQKRLRDEKQAAAVALQESEARVRLLLESTAEAIYGLDLTGKCTFCNPAALRLFGYPDAEALLGRNLHGLAHHGREYGEGGRECGCPLFQSLASGGTLHLDGEELWRSDGSRFFAEYWSHPVRKEGRAVGSVVTVIDITERRSAEKRIREQASLLDLAHDAIIVRDLDNTVKFWSNGAQRLYGWSSAEAVNRSMIELVYTDEARFKAAQKQLLDSGEWYGEMVQRSQKRKALVVMARWTLLRDEEGKPTSVLVINTDVTEKKDLEAQFLRAQRLESIGTLAGGIAHDLNNILAPILMAASMLREELSVSKREEYVNSIEQNAQRGADVLRQLLAFARGVDGERIPLRPEALIHEVVEMARQTFPKSIAIRCELARELWPIVGDSTRLHQVLLNLAVNGRDAMEQGGDLTILARNDELAPTDARGAAGLHPEPRKPGCYVAITVADTGVGIPQEAICKIFDPFFTTKEQGKGTGLGLSTALGIVKSHGGSIEVESHVGSGTRFTVFLPANGTGAAGAGAGAGTAAPENKGALPSRGNGEWVLVVDDEAGIRDMVKLILTRNGYRVLTACDGTEAVAQYVRRAGDIQVILADVIMPVMDGVALARVIRGMDPKARVIASSGIDSDPRIHELKALGVEHILRKPYKSAQLLGMISEVLNPKSPK